jgi:hypothetical protein
MTRTGRPSPPAAAPLVAAFALGLAAVAGCGKKAAEEPDLPLVPVAGKVTSGGQPVTSGMMTFYPDDTKGNTFKGVANGPLDGSGNFTLKSAGKEGAPVGWYKVSVGAGMPGMGGAQAGGEVNDPNKAAKLGAPLNPKYMNPATSGLSVEVTQTPPPGGYEIKVAK